MTPRVVTDPLAIADVHGALLTPSFPPNELVAVHSLVEGVAGGAVEVAVIDDQGEPVAVAVGEVEGPVALLAYLAVDGAARGRGNGSALLEWAVARWMTRSRGIRLLLAEVEDPQRHAPHASYGDPVRRAQFYAAQGATRLAVPYFQPRLDPQSDRVRGMMLVVLAAAPGVIVGGVLREPRLVTTWLEDYFADTEGNPRPADAEAQALFEAFEGGEPVTAGPLMSPTGS